MAEKQEYRIVRHSDNDCHFFYVVPSNRVSEAKKWLDSLLIHWVDLPDGQREAMPDWMIPARIEHIRFTDYRLLKGD